MSGHTLIELTAVLALMTVGASMLVPAARRQADRAAVVEARETVAAMLVRTRALAVAGGGATLSVDAGGRRLRIVTEGSTVEEVGLPPRVELRAGGSDRTAEIAFNALGLGVFANETLELRLGRERARLVVSSHGRVRRQ